ncbi:protein NYNRIN-like [Chenopodium quinoa]|uniref:protein NYNRIN-like n=1 Tax=Chenopodium quinoa TaxID=63459 RepID=UPI000B792BD3|nr:protein NYNRIN-like [Chenopodium quinoa]
MAQAIELHPIIKPLPFRSSMMDEIRPIKPPSSAHHKHILIATDYFTKWIEVQAFKSLNARAVILFLEEKIFTRYGIPESITLDQETMFTGHEFNSYIKEFESNRYIQLTPYFVQANGQAKATNKVISKGIAKMVDENPKNWHVLLHYAIWAY